MSRLSFIAIAFTTGFALPAASRAHPADQSAMRARVERDRLEIRMTFSLLTLTRFAPLDADGDGRLAFTEIKSAEGPVVRYLNEHILLEVNGQKAALGSKATFDYLWPRPEETAPMMEPEYSLQKADVLFDVPLLDRVLEDFWIGFQIFEQTGPLQTISAIYEQDDQIVEVPFSVDEPEYLYDAAYAASTGATKAHAAQGVPPESGGKGVPPGWLFAAAGAVLIVAAWSWRLRTRNSN